MTGGKGVDAVFLLQDVDLRHRHAGSDGHLLDHVVQALAFEIGRVAPDAHTTERARHDATTLAQLHGLEQARKADHGHHDERAEEGGRGIARDVVERRETWLLAVRRTQQREQNDIEHADDDDHRNDEGDDEPARLAARFDLARVEIHYAPRPRESRDTGSACQVKLTFGASRASGFAMSSSCAGAKLNMPATTLLGNTSRLLLYVITASLYAWRANATLFSVDVSSSESCIMFWFALRSGYAAATANRRPSAPPSTLSAPAS